MRHQYQYCILACMAFSLFCGSAIGIPVLGQECPADGTAIRSAFDSTDQTMPERLLRNGIASDCAAPKSFPGTISETNLFETFAFTNLSKTACVTATLDVGTCGPLVHLMAYVNSFDPNSIETNYLGDVGESVSQPFSFVVPKGRRFVVVAQTNEGPTSCAYRFTLSGTECTQPAPALSGLGIAGSVALLLLVGLHAFVRSSRSRVPPLPGTRC